MSKKNTVNRIFAYNTHDNMISSHYLKDDMQSKSVWNNLPFETVIFQEYHFK